MLIKVKENNIKEGIKNSPDSCPVAYALLDAGCKNPSVLENDVVFSNNSNVRKWFSLPDEAIEFISKFDKGEAVEPFEFEISARGELYK